MGVLGNFFNPLAYVDVDINVDKTIREEVDKPVQIVMNDTRIKLPTKEDISYSNNILIAYNIDEYVKQRTHLILLPEVEISIDKIITIDVSMLSKVEKVTLY